MEQRISRQQYLDVMHDRAYLNNLIREQAKVWCAQEQGQDVSNPQLREEYYQKVVDTTNLSELVSSILFVMERRMMGQHENIRGDIRQNIVSPTAPDPIIQKVYGGMEDTLRNHLEKEFKYKDESARQQFLEGLRATKQHLELNARGEELREEMAGKIFGDIRAAEISFLKSNGFSDEEASTQAQWDQEYDHRQKLNAEFKVDIMNYLDDYYTELNGRLANKNQGQDLER